MAIDSFTINGDKDYYSYDALLGRIASVEFEGGTGTLKFKDENGTEKLSVSIASVIEAFNLYLDSTLTEENKPAAAKAVGDAIAAVRRLVPSIDSTLTVPNQAADAKETGDRIASFSNSIATINELEDRVAALEARMPILTLDNNGIIDVGYAEN